MKHGKITLGQIEAIINKLGGEKGVGQFLSGKTIVCTTKTSNKFENDLNDEFDRTNEGKGWKLQKDTSPYIKKKFVPKFAEVSLEELGDNVFKFIGATPSNYEAHCGQHYAKYLLQHQELIPEKYQDKTLVFPRTEWKRERDSTECKRERYSGYEYCIPCLWYINHKWELVFKEPLYLDEVDSFVDPYNDYLIVKHR
jgi:hypothetical protein